jgi:hypothetical protein
MVAVVSTPARRADMIHKLFHYQRLTCAIMLRGYEMFLRVSIRYRMLRLR